jgi:HlyD family secretion protein
LADLRSGARQQEIEGARANANIAAVNLKKASDDLERLKALFTSGAISQSDLEKAQAAFDICTNQLKAAESTVSLLESGSRPEVIKGAETELEKAKAVLKADDVLLEDLKITSPLIGVVLTKNYEEGEYVPAGVSIATVANLDDLWIKVYVPTDDMPKVSLGQKVQFTISGSETVFDGVVKEIASKGEYTPKTIQTKKERANVVFAVKIGIKNKNGILKPGIPADVVFPKVK